MFWHAKLASTYPFLENGGFISENSEVNQEEDNIQETVNSKKISEQRCQDDSCGESLGSNEF
jgi:hypothetical protein